MIFKLFRLTAAILFLPLIAYSQTFEARGDQRLVGIWSCSPPNVIASDPDSDMTLQIKFMSSGTNLVDFTVTTRDIFGETQSISVQTENLYRLDGTTLTEKEIHSDVVSLKVEGEEVSEAERKHTAAFMADIGTVATLQLEFLSATEIVIDEDTDNIKCHRLVKANEVIVK